MNDESEYNRLKDEYIRFKKISDDEDDNLFRFSRKWNFPCLS